MRLSCKEHELQEMGVSEYAIQSFVSINDKERSPC
ncbi:hypothetical protein E2C01_098669 [Portunus trituberculatus]|uniref:Uncharacterized protein n=1 Tax=Portunus trituberculatus TaxID=210409 RepID=A0A5B7JYD8_PORTR|nr:hypothetical protein [Portunus trituberculatus]